MQTVSFQSVDSADCALILQFFTLYMCKFLIDETQNKKKYDKKKLTFLSKKKKVQ